MHGELACEGKIELGKLPKEVTRKLTDFEGNWLEYSAKESAIIVRHTQPAGCPAFSAVPCELMAMLTYLLPTQREKSPGGELRLMSRGIEVLRLVVALGEIRVQWPHPDFSRLKRIPSEQAYAHVNEAEARIQGWARFNGGKAEVEALQKALDQFDGLYDEGELVPDYQQKTVMVKFKDVNMGPRELVEHLKKFAKPITSLQAELDVSSFASDSAAADFRIRISEGKVETYRPELWR